MMCSYWKSAMLGQVLALHRFLSTSIANYVERQDESPQATEIGPDMNFYLSQK